MFHAWLDCPTLKQLGMYGRGLHFGGTSWLFDVQCCAFWIGDMTFLYQDIAFQMMKTYVIFIFLFFDI